MSPAVETSGQWRSKTVGRLASPHWAEPTFIGGSCASCFGTFLPMKLNMSFAGFRLYRAVLTFVTNFCSRLIVITCCYSIINVSSASFYGLIQCFLRLQFIVLLVILYNIFTSPIGFHR